MLELKLNSFFKFGLTPCLIICLTTNIIAQQGDYNNWITVETNYTH